MYGAPNDFRQYAEASYEQDILAHDLLSNRTAEAGGDKWRQLVEQFYNIVGGGVIGDKSWKLTQGGTDPVAVISVLTRLTRNSTSLSDSDKQRALDILAQLRSMAPMVARRMTMKNDKNNKRYDNTVQSASRYKEKTAKALAHALGKKGKLAHDREVGFHVYSPSSISDDVAIQSCHNLDWIVNKMARSEISRLAVSGASTAEGRKILANRIRDILRKYNSEVKVPEDFFD